MAKQCDTCGQSYADEEPGCPHCSAAGSHRGAVNGVLKDNQSTPGTLSAAAAEAAHVSDPEIDLGSPVTSAQAGTGPPSGASFTSWADLAPTPKLAPSDQTPVRFEQLEDGSLRSRTDNPEPSEDTGDAEIDLCASVGNPDNGPISGASTASWTSLLKGRKAAKAAEAPVEFGELPPGALVPAFAEAEPIPRPPREPILTARGLMETPDSEARQSAPDLENRIWWHGFLLGALLAVVACLTLWLVGVEPPTSWRQAVQQGLGQDAAVPSLPTPSNP